ncbi:hypothetical protein HMPREF3149_03930 [Corynebacterium sp. HMSC05E07]|nr:hypothetical protein HMPREF3149_03930 [Corynebacterium sp. HMSC05E07]
MPIGNEAESSVGAIAEGQRASRQGELHVEMVAGAAKVFDELFRCGAEHALGYAGRPRRCCCAWGLRDRIQIRALSRKIDMG